VDDADVFIAASEDCRGEGALPTKPGSVAAVQYRMLVEEPYRHTQGDVLFASSTAVRAGEPADRDAFFARPQACLRCSPLVKTHGWGIHFDAQGRAAAYPKGSEAYARLTEDGSLRHTRGMRSRKG